MCEMYEYAHKKHKIVQVLGKKRCVFDYKLAGPQSCTLAVPYYFT